MKRLASTRDNNVVFKFCGQGSRANFASHFVQVENISSLGPSATQGETEDEGDSCAGEEEADCGGKVGEVEFFNEKLEGSWESGEESHGEYL